MDNRIVFKKLGPEHLPFFYEIRFSVYENLLHAHQIQYLQRDQALDDISQGGGWICQIDDIYAGMGFGIFIPEPIIGGLFVKPEFQSKGIGSQLLSRVTEWFSEKNAPLIKLTTDENSKALNFYKRRGWVVKGPDETGLQLILTTETKS